MQVSSAHYCSAVLGSKSGGCYSRAHFQRNSHSGTPILFPDCHPGAAFCAAKDLAVCRDNRTGGGGPGVLFGRNLTLQKVAKLVQLARSEGALGINVKESRLLI